MAEHGLATPALTAISELNPAQLRRLRLQALEELASALREHADPEHLERVAPLVGAVDQRLERLDA